MGNVLKNLTSGVLREWLGVIWGRWFDSTSLSRDLDRQSVCSLSIVAVGYDASDQTLQVEYRNGWVYEAASVPWEVFDRVMAASKFGPAYRRLILGHYTLQRVGRVTPIMCG